MTQHSGPKAVAMVNLGKYCLTAQEMISCGDERSNRRLCSANSSSNWGEAATVGGAAFSGRIADCIVPKLVVAVMGVSVILSYFYEGQRVN